MARSEKARRRKSASLHTDSVAHYHPRPLPRRIKTKRAAILAMERELLKEYQELFEELSHFDGEYYD